MLIAELEKRKLEEENRAKEMADAISEAQARAQAAEQKTLEASKIAEEKIRKAVQEASKLQETFAEAMKRFNMNPSIRKKIDKGKRREVSMDSDSDSEVFQPTTSTMSKITDDDEQMSQHTLPPSSDGEEDTKRRKRVSFSKVRLLFFGLRCLLITFTRLQMRKSRIWKLMKRGPPTLTKESRGKIQGCHCHFHANFLRLVEGNTESIYVSAIRRRQPRHTTLPEHPLPGLIRAWGAT
jgi:hypothetical protein